MKHFLQLITAFVLAATAAQAQTPPPAPNYHCLAHSPFTQNWTDASLITTSHDWSAPKLISIRGFRGDAGNSLNAVDPGTILADDNALPFATPTPAPPVYNVNANIATPATYTTGGVGELATTDPCIGFKGSGTADFPFIKIYLCTAGASNITVAFDLLDMDNGVNNSISPVAIQARIGNSGSYSLLGNYTDVTDGPSLTKAPTNVSFVLPAGCNNKEKIELRIITSNAVGTDEFIGIDNINISAGTAAPITTLPTTPATYTGSYECVNGTTDGFTHYYNNGSTSPSTTNDILLLSINSVATGMAANASQVTVGVLPAVANVSAAGFVTNTNGFYAIPRYWNVAPTTQPTTPATVRFYYTAAELAALNTTLGALPMPGAVTPANATVYKFTDATANPDPSTGHTGSTSVNYLRLTQTSTTLPNNDIQTEFAAASFSGGGVGGGGGGAGRGPLPVAYLYFNAKNINAQANQLSWATTTETNNAYFAIERSHNAQNYTTIAKVLGNGTTNETTNYTYIDAAPLKGIAHYRLRQTDFDGKFVYSNIVSCKILEDKAFVILPNITQNTFEVQAATRYNTLTISDIYGKTVQILPYTNTYDISNLAAGIYYIRRNDSPAPQKIVKQ